MNVVHLNNVSKIYGKADYQTAALKNVSLSVAKGEFVSIMGASGSGKSTLLHIIGCMEKPTEGQCLILEQDTAGLSDNKLSKIRNQVISFIFQHFALMHNYSVYDNVILPLFKRDMKSKIMKEKASYYLERLGISDLMNKNVTKLSGGQKQRVAIARALVAETEIILADEPTGALDQKNSHELMDLLSTINSEGKTIIMVTHDENIAKYTNRTILLSDGAILDHSM